MNSLQIWINDLLLQWGVVPEAKTLWDNVIILLLILLFAFVIDYVGKYFILNAFERIAKRTKNQWDDLIFEKRIIHRLINIAAVLFIYVTLPLAFEQEHVYVREVLRRLFVVYMIIVSTRVANAFLAIIYRVYAEESVQKNTNNPVKGFVQVLQIVVIFIAVILIIAVIVNKSPVTLFAGLGASAAILSLVFKDTLLGFVAGIQLSLNDMLRPGDWIIMPKYGVDGTIAEITLNTVKIKNGDNSITTIPPYLLITDSFQNWRGMKESEGRRIKRFIYIDMNTVKFCTPDMLDKFRKITLLTDYIDGKEKELKQRNGETQINDSVVNGQRQTNLGIFRAYVEQYLRHHPAVNQELTCLVRHLQPTENGIPVELYFYSKEKDWKPYENIASDIFDHVLASIQTFDLQVFQVLQRPTLS